MSTYDGYGDYGYDDEPRRYRNVSGHAAHVRHAGDMLLTAASKVRTRPRERDEPDYVREETYI